MINTARFPILLSFITVSILLAGCSEPEENFEYKMDGRKVTITGYTGTAETLNIPSEIKGRKVTRIAGGAFEDCSGLVKIKIPSSVTSIGHGAFK